MSRGVFSGLYRIPEGFRKAPKFGWGEVLGGVLQIGRMPPYSF